MSLRSSIVAMCLALAPVYAANPMTCECPASGASTNSVVTVTETRTATNDPPVSTVIQTVTKPADNNNGGGGGNTNVHTVTVSNVVTETQTAVVTVTQTAPPVGGGVKIVTVTVTNTYTKAGEPSTVYQTVTNTGGGDNTNTNSASMTPPVTKPQDTSSPTGGNSNSNNPATTTDCPPEGPGTTVDITMTTKAPPTTIGDNGGYPTTTASDHPFTCHHNGTCYNHSGKPITNIVTFTQTGDLCGVSTLLETVYNTITATVVVTADQPAPSSGFGGNSTVNGTSTEEGVSRLRARKLLDVNAAGHVVRRKY
ncbi:uncharacterized protein E0L32_005856 [Thyridium curvatum]|uniref:Uncharacterized protein n=1 Tax=Thyridium curvatum TaxID=1093900 RepID=A0A507B1A1_9PEZI|nr:uncharacterized protein E0L32_005856 [Thyridium curvatum]TPX13653.1 hypothetical protein E0L32_005856 [Thyridium curvatum]